MSFNRISWGDMNKLNLSYHYFISCDVKEIVLEYAIVPNFIIKIILIKSDNLWKINFAEKGKFINYFCNFNFVRPFISKLRYIWLIKDHINRIK